VAQSKPLTLPGLIRTSKLTGKTARPVVPQDLSDWRKVLLNICYLCTDAAALLRVTGEPELRVPTNKILLFILVRVS